MPRALIVGLSGPDLTSAEAAYLTRVRPCGVIVFARNVDTPERLRRLVADAKSALGTEDLLVLVDQEGGRVRRLRPPHWRDLPAAAAYALAYDAAPEATCRSAGQIARLTASDLRRVGINTNCVPCADVPIEGADAIIGDRAYGTEPGKVAALARAVADGHLAGGVLPVVKHIPGHGRADRDSHLALPIVTAPIEELKATDFAPFRTLRDLPAAMTAHVVYAAVDPTRPATTSPDVLDRVVRGSIGFSGLLMSDDLSMAALSGDLASRASAAIAAGCDVALHCNGRLDEMEMVAAATPVLAGAAETRYAHCLDCVRAEPDDPDETAIVEAHDALMQLGAAPFPGESV